MVQEDKRDKAMPMKIYADQIEIAVAKFFNFRQNLIVPNISWGFGLSYEADMIVVRPNGWVIEIEIKVSKPDLLADEGKMKWRHGCIISKSIRQHYFAVPDELVQYVNIPLSGILRVGLGRLGSRGGLVASLVRPGKLNPRAVKISPEKRSRLAELGCMRIWSLKEARRKEG